MASAQAQFESAHGPFSEIQLSPAEWDNIEYDDMNRFYEFHKTPTADRLTRPEWETFKLNAKTTWQGRGALASIVWKAKYALAAAGAIAGGIAAAEYAAGEFEDAQFALQENTEGISSTGVVSMGKWKTTDGVFVEGHMVYPGESEMRTASNGKRYFPYTNKKGSVEFIYPDEQQEESIEETHARQKEPEETDWSQYMEGGMGEAHLPSIDETHQRQKEPVMVYSLLII